MLKQFAFIITVVIFLVFSFFVYSVDSAGIRVQVVATTEIYSAKIVRQNNNQLDISFDFFNQQGVQPGIKYGVQLLKDSATGSPVVIDDYVYPEVIDLKAGETKKMEIAYKAPDFLQGEFLLRLIAKTSGGLPLAFSNLGGVVLSGSGQFVEIFQETCYLEQETLIATCKVKNHLNQSIVAKIRFQTFLGTEFGSEVVLAGVEQNKDIEIATDEQKTISFYLPKPELPNQYETQFWLDNENGQISNKVIFKYNIEGASALIENIVLNKDYYQKGETAQVKILWSSTNRQPGEQFYFIIKDNKGRPCSEGISQSLDGQTSFLTVSVQIIKDCAGPKVEASIKDKQGNVLDSKALSVSSRQAGFHKLWQIIVLVIAILFLLAAAIAIRKQRSGKGIFLLLVIGVSVYFGFGYFSEARATTTILECYGIDFWGGGGVILLFDMQMTTLLDKSEYTSNEEARATLDLDYTDYDTGDVYKADCFMGSVDINNYGNAFNNSCTNSSFSADVYREVQQSAGSYDADFTVQFDTTCTPYEDEIHIIINEGEYASFDIDIPYSVSSTCTADGNLCPTAPGATCCSYCDQSTNKCGTSACTADGQTCPTAPGATCCSYCDQSRNKCGPQNCLGIGHSCTSNSQCCSGTCKTFGDGTRQCYSPSTPCYVQGYYPCTPANGERPCCNGLYCKTPENICESAVCPPTWTYCPYDTPLGQRVYDAGGQLCPSGSLVSTCPPVNTYCPNTVLLDENCGRRCPQGTRACKPQLGFVSAQGNSGPIRLSLMSITDFHAYFPWTLRVRKPVQGVVQTVAADLVAVTDPEASPVRVQTPAGILAWRTWGPGFTPPPPSCISAGASCQYSDDCCNKTCSAVGSCVCKANSVSCVKDIECCTQNCSVTSKKCECIYETNPLTCRQNSDCCYSGVCAIRSGGTTKTCCFPAGTYIGSFPEGCYESGGFYLSSLCCSGRCNYSTQTCN